MNEIANKFLLEGDTFMPDMHLRQPASLDKLGFIYSACRPFTKCKERIQKFKETRYSQHIHNIIHKTN